MEYIGELAMRLMLYIINERAVMLNDEEQRNRVSVATCRVVSRACVKKNACVRAGGRA